MTYLSSNSIEDKSDDNYGDSDEAFLIEFLNSICAFGVSNHNLLFKVGAPIMILRNIDHSEGLLQFTQLMCFYFVINFSCNIDVL